MPDVSFGASCSPESRVGLRVCMEKAPAGAGLGPTMGLEHSEQPAPVRTQELPGPTWEPQVMALSEIDPLLDILLLYFFPFLFYIGLYWTFNVVLIQVWFSYTDTCIWASQVALVVKNPPANAGDSRDVSLVPGSRRSLGGGHGNPLQYSCLENPMDRGAWWATVHRVAKSQTWLKQLSMNASILE